MNEFYDPDTGKLHAVTVYGWFHEYAHQHQHATGSMLFALRQRLLRVPIISYAINLAVEIDASARALCNLMRCGILELRDVADAWRGLRTHLLPGIILNRSTR